MTHCLHLRRKVSNTNESTVLLDQDTRLTGFGVKHIANNASLSKDSKGLSHILNTHEIVKIVESCSHRFHEACYREIVKTHRLKRLNLNKLSVDEKRCLARNKSTSVDDLAVLAEESNWGVRHSVAGNPYASTATLTMLARDENWYVLDHLAQNISTPAPVLSLLASYESVGAPSVVEKMKTSGIMFLFKLSYGRDKLIRQSVAQNPNTMPQDLSFLSSDPHWGVRKEVAYNRNTPHDAMKKLLGDKRWEVRWCAANNPAAPSDGLAEMASSDPVPALRRFAQSRGC